MKRCRDLYQKDVCQLVYRSIKIGQAIRENLTSLIISYDEYHEKLDELVRELQRLAGHIVRIQENEEVFTLCDRTISINSALEGTDNVLKNIEYIRCIEYCDEIPVVLVKSADIFNGYTLSTLCTLWLDCNMMDSYRSNNSSNDGYCKGNRSNRIICETITNSGNLASEARRILSEMLRNFNFKEESQYTQLVEVLANNFRIIDNEMQFVLSQLNTIYTMCPEFVVRERLIFIRRAAAFLKIAVYELDRKNDPCYQLNLISAFYRHARALMIVLYEVRELIGCCLQEEKTGYNRGCSKYVRI